MNVIMFHSVGCDKTDWSRKHLSIPIKAFEGFCRFLCSGKYSTCFLDEWYEQNDQFKGKEHLVLTFDDGYLDNWVYLFPLLKKYGLRATLFISPEFVDPSIGLRKNLNDVWNGEAQLDELQSLGFLNWNEIRTMQDSGYLDVQSHSMSHNWVFSSDRVVDIFYGQEEYDWLDWLITPQAKYDYTSKKRSSQIPIGYPVFEFDRALKVREFKPSEHFIEYAVSLAKNYGGREDISTCKEEIIDKLKQYSVREKPGDYETTEEQKTRYRYELAESKRILEEKLAKQVNYLCWPGGGYNDLSLELSKEVGYKASTLSSKDTYGKTNGNNGRYKRIKRMTISTKISSRKRDHYLLQSKIMGYSYLAKNGSLPHKLLLRSLKGVFLLAGLFSNA